MPSIEQVIAWLNRLYGLPAAALVFAACIAFGYGLRFVKAFPNPAIPVAVILFGAIAMSLVADSRATSMSLRVWVVRNILVGMIIGFVSWLAHRLILSRLEDWIGARFNLGNTDFFKKKDQPNDPNPDPDPNP